MLQEDYMAWVSDQYAYFSIARNVLLTKSIFNQYKLIILRFKK